MDERPDMLKEALLTCPEEDRKRWMGKLYQGMDLCMKQVTQTSSAIQADKIMASFAAMTMMRSAIKKTIQDKPATTPTRRKRKRKTTKRKTTRKRSTMTKQERHVRIDAAMKKGAVA